MAKPDRGEIWLVELGYVAKTKPCLVLHVPITKDQLEQVEDAVRHWLGH